MDRKYPTRPGCTGNPPCLTDAGAQAKRRDEMKQEERDRVRNIMDQHDQSVAANQEYIDRLNEGWSGDDDRDLNPRKGEVLTEPTI